MARLDRSLQHGSGDRPAAPVRWRVRAVVGFAAGVFVATLLAVFSAAGRDELWGWWVAALGFAVFAWGAVAGSEWLGRKLLAGVAFGGGRAARVLGFVALFAAALGLAALVGWVSPLSAVGMVLTVLPFLAVVAIYWNNAGSLGVASALVAGVVLFLICVRMFTMPGARDLNLPELAPAGDDDVRVMSWNVGGGAPFFGGSDEGDIAAIAATVEGQGVHVLCLQEVSSQGFVDKLVAALGSGWRGHRAPGEGRSAAVLSRIGGVFETGPVGGATVARIASDKGQLQFVSFQASAGRTARGRRAVADWVLNEVRAPGRKTVVAADFRVDPARGWSFLTPLFSDSPTLDRATWKTMQVLGQDPGFGGRATGGLGRRTDWVVVDTKMEVTGYQVLDPSGVGGMDHRPVLVRVGLGRGGGLAPREPLAAGAPSPPVGTP